MGAYHQQNPRKQKRTAAEVQGWRKLMKANGWNQKELAAALNISEREVSVYLMKEAYGELRG